eukprot:g25064.t1
MSFGVRHMLQSINYYLLGLCMVQLYVPHVGFVLTLVFQATTLSSQWEIAWFELLHWVASPSSNESSTPRHFRAVLFMDVFGDAEDPLTGGSLTRGADPAEVLAEVQLSFEAFRVAQCCLRRWEEVPGDWLPLSQKREVNQFSDYLRLETDAFADLLLEIGSEMQVDNRSWTQLSQDERLVEPCSGTVLGPFYYSRGRKYKLLFTSPGAMRVLTLDETLKAVRKFQQLISHVHRISGVKSVAKPEPAGAPNCLTRTTQLMWLGVGFIAAFRETDMMRFDFQVSYIVEERRLQESDEFIVDHGSQTLGQELPVQWPYGSFFRIEALRCMENSTIAVSTRFASYALRDARDPDGIAQVREMEPVGERFCGQIGCLDFAPTLDWPWQSSAGSNRSPPRYAGALEPCEALERISDQPGPLCLVLVFEGDNGHLKIMHAELPAGASAGRRKVLHSTDFAPPAAVQPMVFGLAGGILWLWAQHGIDAYNVLLLEPVLQWQRPVRELQCQPIALCRFNSWLLRGALWSWNWVLVKFIFPVFMFYGDFISDIGMMHRFWLQEDYAFAVMNGLAILAGSISSVVLGVHDFSEDSLLLTVMIFLQLTPLAVVVQSIGLFCAAIDGSGTDPRHKSLDGYLRDQVSSLLARATAGEAFTEALLSIFVQTYAILRQDISWTPLTITSILFSIGSIVKSFSNLDKRGHVSREIKGQGIVVGLAEMLSPPFLLTVAYRLAEVSSQILFFPLFQLIVDDAQIFGLRYSGVLLWAVDCLVQAALVWRCTCTWKKLVYAVPNTIGTFEPMLLVGKDGGAVLSTPAALHVVSHLVELVLATVFVRIFYTERLDVVVEQQSRILWYLAACNGALRKYACFALEVLASNDSIRGKLANDLLSDDLVEAVLSNLSEGRNRKDALLQTAACGLIAKLAAHDQLRQRFLNRNPPCTEEVLTSMREHPNDADVQRNACFALRCLVPCCDP